MTVSWSHTITLPYPVSTVFPKLSEAQHMERLHLLPPVAQNFRLFASDKVQLPKSGLQALFSPNHPASAEGLPRPRTMKATEDVNTDPELGETVERANIEWSGSLSNLFGLVRTPLFVKGSQIVEKHARTVLYESIVEASGVKELKVRTFEEVMLDDGSGNLKEGTKVKETVWVTSPFYLGLIVKLVSPGVHRGVMELYGQLF
ncbi:hypothetical protein CPB83DRAFT_837000 [Crepidotus variabilis]|uniref:Uncharacterized protein n=1 Tax=Crepidotus variabilis TaxID=179855 RepID=A0A9P6ED39_9AGAR|nr:hypothetical protein CPB83DRAFT_837000 [Crepidotus variabilis]